MALAVDKIKELMETGNSDPIGERAAQESQPETDGESAEETTSNEDDIAFDDL